jgi:lambda repressor-like predicted transcriptional regulator
MDQQERRKKIKIRLIERGIMIKDIAAKAGVVPAYISAIIAGDKKNHRLRKLVAKALGFKPTDLWDDANEIQDRRRRQTSRTATNQPVTIPTRGCCGCESHPVQNARGEAL